MQHICIISQRYPCDATPTVHVFVQKIVWAMRDAGINVTVISPVPSNSKTHTNTPEHSVETTSKGNEIQLYRPRYLYLGQRKGVVRLSEKNFFSACQKVVAKMEKMPDAFYGHFIVMSGICACRLGRKFNRPSYIAYGESTDEPLITYGMEAVRKELKSAAGIIAVSTKNKNNLMDNKIAEEGKIAVFVNGVNTGLFYPRPKDEARAKYKLKDNDFVVAFVGQFTERKGIHIVDEAVQSIDGVKALYAGKGSWIPKGEHVVAAEPIPSKDVPWLLSAADIFVFPSQHEGCSNAILEAMACGLPIVASDLEFNYDILDDSNAILVDGLNVMEVESAIRKLKENPALRGKMREATLNRVKNLSIEQRAKNIIAWIDKRNDDVGG